VSVVKHSRNTFLVVTVTNTIFDPLHDRLSGWALPQYIIDIPGGEGKTPAFNPESFEFSGELINRKGEKVKIN
jgi:lysine 2,3-aminomutase